jgi:hypothetical protein
MLDMEKQHIHDKDGEWLINTANFTFVDAESGCRFEPRVPTKAVYTVWAKGQPVIQKWVDPEQPKAPEVPVTKPAPKK